MKGNFVSVKQVASMIARSHKHLAFDIYDIVEWCGEAVKNISAFESFVHFTHGTHPGCRIEIKNRQALLPCNVYRLLGVYHRNRPLSSTEYIRDDNYLRFNKRHHDILWDFDHIEIDYIGIPVDEDGFPKIDEISLQACYWYCLKMLMLEDFLNGKVPGGAYEYIEEQYGKYVAKAKSSFKNISHNDMNEIAMILYNMVPKMRLPKNIG